MQKPHIDSPGTFAVATVIVGLQDDFKIRTIPCFPAKPYIFCLQIMVIPGPGNTRRFTQLTDIQKVIVPLCHFPNDLIFGRGRNVHCCFSSLPKDTIFLEILSPDLYRQAAAPNNGSSLPGWCSPRDTPCRYSDPGNPFRPSLPDE